MRSKYHPALRFISAVALAFFAWSFAGGYQIACAVKMSEELETRHNQQGFSKAEGPGEQFERALAELRKSIKDPTGDPKTKKSKAKAKKVELEKLDRAMQEEFAGTEDHLTQAGLPAEILERHNSFVAHYEKNMKELMADLDRIEQAATEAHLKREIESAEALLDKAMPPKKHKPLDPKKLPHRAAEPVHKEPRTKPEEFKPESRAQNLLPLQNPILLASSGPLEGLLGSPSEAEHSNFLLAQAANLPTPEDLSQTIEVQFTPEITAKAAELDHNPVKIYNWVRNNIEFVPTYGSIQGANMTLQTKQGNAFDTASLLIALFRASGIPARYAYGTIELPIEEVMNWVGGFTDPNAALNFIASGGIPVTGLVSGGKIEAARMEHVWVEAYIDYFPSRGARHQTGQGDTWIPLDASFKQYHYTHRAIACNNPGL